MDGDKGEVHHMSLCRGEKQQMESLCLHVLYALLLYVSSVRVSLLAPCFPSVSLA